MNQTHFRRVIIVDDDFASLFLAKLVIEEANIAETVLTFHQPVDAMHYLMQYCIGENTARKDCPDLVLLDLNMPVMDGFEFLERLQMEGLSQFAQTRVVVLSSSNNPKDRQMVEQYKVRHFLQKPITEDHLAALLT